MSRTIRNIPPRYGNVEWFITHHKAPYLAWANLRTGKSDRGDGLSSGWREPCSAKAAREAKRLARRAMRRASRRMEQQ